MDCKCTLRSVAPADRSDIEQFVRRTLGCQCPDEVFASVAIARVAARGCPQPVVRLVVGDRLLIYIVENDEVGSREDVVQALAQAGRLDRDEHGLNRFRLVVAGDCDERRETALRERFESSTAQDARTHLHVVAPDALPGVLRARPAQV